MAMPFDKPPDFFLVIAGKTLPGWNIDSAVLQVWLGGPERVDELIRSGEIVIGKPTALTPASLPLPGERPVGPVVRASSAEATRRWGLRMEMEFDIAILEQLANLALRHDLDIGDFVEGILILALADAECSSTQTDAIARAAQVVAMDKKEGK